MHLKRGFICLWAWFQYKPYLDILLSCICSSRSLQLDNHYLYLESQIQPSSSQAPVVNLVFGSATNEDFKISVIRKFNTCSTLNFCHQSSILIHGHTYGSLTLFSSRSYSQQDGNDVIFEMTSANFTFLKKYFFWVRVRVWVKIIIKKGLTGLGLGFGTVFN